MKIIFFIFILMFIFRSSYCLNTKGGQSLNKRSDTFTNFIQIANKKFAEKKNKNEFESNYKSNYWKYSVKIIVIKQNDSKDDKPLEFDTNLALTKDSIDLYENGVIKKQINFLDFLFIDGIVLYENIDYFDKIQSEIYSDVITYLKPKVMKYANTYGIEKFNKYCSSALRSKYIDKKVKSLGKIMTSIIFCLSDDTTEERIKNFNYDFIVYYTNTLVNEKNLMKIQNYRLKQNIQIQYYDPMEKINIENPKLPNFFTSFSKEGLVLNEDKNYDPLKVKYSFRFDQVVECTGGEASSLKAIIRPEISVLFRPDFCCISYLVDWQQKGVKNMFCSMYIKDWKCKVDIKIFQSTLYQYCIMNQIEKLNKIMINNNNSIYRANLYFLERASIITVLREILYTDIENYVEENSYLFTLIKREKVRAKYDLYYALRSFDLDKKPQGELAKKKGCKFGKEEFFLENTGEGYVINNEETSISRDFEEINRQEIDSLFSNAAMSIQILKEMKYSFCKELWRMKVEDDSEETIINRKYINKTKILIQRIKNIRRIAIHIVNIIKINLGGRKLTDTEIIRITNIIIRNPKVFVLIIKFNIRITYEIIHIIITNEEDGIKVLWKLIREKAFKLKYENDPTFHNSTQGCNKTKKVDDPIPTPDPIIPQIPELTLDDWSGYIDEGDFMKIPGISAEYFTEKAKNQTIIVPRVIPMKNRDNKPPSNITYPKFYPNTTDENDDEPEPIMPMNPNPGVIDDLWELNNILIPPKPSPKIVVNCRGPNCVKVPPPEPPKNETKCNRTDLPPPCDPKLRNCPCTKGVDCPEDVEKKKCKPGVDCPCDPKLGNCPCIKGVNCPEDVEKKKCTPGVDCPCDPLKGNCPCDPSKGNCPCVGDNCPKPPLNPPNNDTCLNGNCNQTKPIPIKNQTDEKVYIYAAETVYNNDPLKRPKKEGIIVKYEVEKEDAKKMEKIVDMINDGKIDSGNNNFNSNNPQSINPVKSSSDDYLFEVIPQNPNNQINQGNNPLALMTRLQNEYSNPSKKQHTFDQNNTIYKNQENNIQDGTEIQNQINKLPLNHKLNNLNTTFTQKALAQRRKNLRKKL